MGVPGHLPADVTVPSEFLEKVSRGVVARVLWSQRGC